MLKTKEQGVSSNSAQLRMTHGLNLVIRDMPRVIDCGPFKLPPHPHMASFLPSFRRTSTMPAIAGICSLRAGAFNQRPRLPSAREVLRSAITYVSSG